MRSPPELMDPDGGPFIPSRSPIGAKRVRARTVAAPPNGRPADLGKTGPMTTNSTPTIRLADIEVPRVGLGTNRLTNTPEHTAFIREAVAAGVRHVDSAHLYTGGDSEAAIGAASLDGAVIATKGGYNAGEGAPAVLRAQIEESLRRLRTDSIALYYLHRVDPQTPLEASLGAIAEHRDKGDIRHVGLSEVSVEQIERAREVVPI